MNVFIAGSSRDNLDSIYYEEASRLSKYLASHQYNLVMGCNKGILQKVALEFSKLDQGIMVMEADPYREIAYDYPVYFHNTIADRKYGLVSNSDILIFLPGGIGSLDEFFTAIESKRAKEYNKEILVVNINHYYDDLFKMLDKMYQEGFADYIENLYSVFDNVDDAIGYIEKLGDKSENK